VELAAKACGSVGIFADVLSVSNWFGFSSITLEGFNEVTSVKTSRDSRCAIVNHAPDVS
jgi:hypothetical protein